MYALICSSGKYKGFMVAKSGRKSSYTNSISNAEKFHTKEGAINSSCTENEYPREISII